MKIFNFVFLSSLPSQVGFLLALDSSLMKLFDANSKTYVFLIVNRNALNKNGVLASLHKKLPNVRFIFVMGLVARIFVILAAYLLNSTMLILKRIGVEVNVFEPKPFWLIPSYFPFIPQNGFNYIYYGDGLSTYCSSSKPFWLSNNKFKTPLPKLCKFKFAHSFEEVAHSSTEKLPNDKLVSGLYEIYDSEVLSNHAFKVVNKALCIKKVKKNLFLLCTSTFESTGRIPKGLQKYIYLDYIVKFENHLLNSDFFIKFHPGNMLDEVNDLTIFFRQHGFDIDLLPELNAIPLDLFLIMAKMSLKYENIYITALTTGAAAAACTFDWCVPIGGFGKELVNKYFNAQYVDGRLKQESLIYDYIKENSVS
jgi:hypothetical protein